MKMIVLLYNELVYVVTFNIFNITPIFLEVVCAKFAHTYATPVLMNVQYLLNVIDKYYLP